MNKAVIFIPGIKGTKIYDANTIDNEVLWQDLRFNFEQYQRTELSFVYNEKYFEEDFSTIVKPLRLEPLAYQEFWKELDPIYDFKFVFPYDWRLPNEENGKKLQEFMDLIIEKSGASKRVDTITHFDFVTHSMGNMPLRYYIKANGMKKVNKIIFVTPPFKGAADAISALVVGQGMFFNKDKIRKLARTLPALFELLPTYENYAIDSKNSNDIDLWQKKNWQKNLTVTQNQDEEKTKSIKKFLANLKNTKPRLDELATWMDKLTKKEKERILILVKTQFKTLTDIVIEKKPTDDNPSNYFDFKLSMSSDEGDGVVPNASSCCYHDKIATYYLQHRILNDDYKHPFIMKDNRVQRIINSFLSSDLGTNEYEHKVIGRTVHRVTSLNPVEITEKGVKHKIWTINA